MGTAEGWEVGGVAPEGGWVVSAGLDVGGGALVTVPVCEGVVLGEERGEARKWGKCRTPVVVTLL